MEHLEQLQNIYFWLAGGMYFLRNYTNSLQNWMANVSDIFAFKLDE